ncbi:unnamed protein product [Adineta ricciae]|uniref:ETFB lysine methyltransferase n=1 Tax=Adineta ricciae TaxID=249248 RepID=A0A814J4Y2_ADIRI|nr:unnamed protein product [Adineta ricciae]CAF1528929.1 unnamed protein product [Adineta ricciae]
MQRKTCEYIFQHLLPPVHRACLLVPELTLSILTSSNPLWNIPYQEAMDKLGRTDPWWAFLWPGSQALSRYVLDNRSLIQGRRVLDLGSGCGASAIASKMAGAMHVIANDIDQDALAATCHNARLNDVTIEEYLSDNVIEKPSIILDKRTVDLLIIGDMCYDQQLSEQVVNLIKTARRYHLRVLLADPGRYSFKKVVLDQLKGIITCACEYPIMDRDYTESDFDSIQIWTT